MIALQSPLTRVSKPSSIQAFAYVFAMALLIAGAAMTPSHGAPSMPLNFVRATKPVVIDGKLDDWVLTAPVSYEVDPNAFDQKVKTYAMWDDQYIYLAYVVRDSSPMKNSGDDPSEAFKTGDSLHFYLGTGSETPASSGEGGPNDYHILMTMQHGKPVIFAFRQKKPGTDKPTRISSPATHIDMDWMGPVPGADMAVVVSGASYTAEVKLPISFFDGFHPAAGQNVAADVAVDFSDPAGTKNIAKVWWSRGASEILDIPTEMRFERNLWGRGVFDAASNRPIVVDSSDTFVVPAPGPVTIDGDLSDWDMSAAYGPLYVDPSLKDKYNITWSMMYDSQALYLAAIFNSGKPLSNDGGVNNVWWLGDSIEVRMALDPANQGGDIKANKDIMTFAFWHNSIDDKDYIALQRSFKFQISDISSATVRSKATPGGRTFEVRIPWSIVQSGNYPKAGDSVSVTMAAIWKDGLRAYGMGSINSFRGMNDWGQAHFLAEKPSQVFVSLNQPIAQTAPEVVKYTASVDVPATGLLSAGVYRADGTLLRTLLAGKSVDAGKLPIGWDGNDDLGGVAPTGTYAIRAVLNSGLHARYVTSATSPGKPAHDSDSPTGGWGGVWDNVLDIASDSTGIYPLWAVEEGYGLLIHADEDGNVLWRQHVPLAQPGVQVGVATNGKYVYVLNDAEDKTGGKAGLWRVSCADGSYIPIPNDGSDPLAFNLDGITKPAPDVTVGATPPPSVRKVREPGAGTAIVADASTIYVAAYYQNQIDTFDSESCKPIKSFAADKPMGICFDGPSALLVVSGTQVVRLDLKSGAITPLLTRGLAAPYHVAVTATGGIVVTDRGASQQVKLFNRSGKLIARFGKAGGRDNNGPFRVETLLNPAGITVTPTGHIFYSEDADPKIFVRLSSDLKYEKLWSGPWYLSGEVCVDPAEPTEMYTHGANDFVRHTIDYTAQTSEPDAVWSDFALPNYGRWFPRIIQNQGKKYLFCGGNPVSLFRIDGDKMLLVAAIGGGSRTKGPGMWTFSDLNENGAVDPGEVVDYPPSPDPLSTYGGSYWGGSIDDRDMTIYLANGNRSVIALTPTFAKPGVPVYSFQNSRIVPLAEAIKPGKLDDLSSIWHAPDGGIFGNAMANGSDPHGIGHSSHLSDVFIYRLDRNGKLMWRAGKKASGIAKNGEFYGRACGLGGPIGDSYFDFVDEDGQDKVYTDDGLFVGNLLDDSSVASPSEYTLRVEHFNSIVYQSALDKKWYFVAGAGGYASIWEIAGLDTITRLTSQITVN